ncbi:MAG: LolA-related protein [Candidatus Thiodiazotropha sp.]
MKKLLLISLFSLLTLAAEASEWNLASLMQALQNQGARQARFSETRTLAILDQPIDQTGLLIFEPPDRLVRRLDPPGNLSAEIVGNQLTLWQGNERKQTLQLDNVPELLAFSASFRAILGGDSDTLQHYFETHLEGDAKAWTLTLTPRESGLAKRIKQIKVEGRGAEIDRYTTQENSGDQTLTRLLPIDAATESH